MPYKSDAQRRFFHTDTAKKAGITDKEVNEFDQASKGKQLPEHTKKMAFGGETNPKHETLSAMENNPTAGFAEGGEVKDKATSLSDIGTLPGLRDLMMRHQRGENIHEAPKSNPDDENKMGKFLGDFTAHASTDSAGAQGYADGGDVTEGPMVAGGYPGAGQNNMSSLMDIIKTGGMSPFLPGGSVTQGLANASANAATSPDPLAGIGGPQLNTSPSMPPAAPAPSPINVNASVPPPSAPLNPSVISQALQTAQQTPSTNPSIYQGISADDRANLMKQLLAQKASPGNLAASGAAGLGDAISNAFGKGGQNAQGQVRQAQAQNVQNQIGVVDTERQQKMQDLQANMAQQENDPASAYSQGMRQFYSQLTGKTFPSGISASMMKQAFPDYAKIFDAQMQAATAQGQQGIEAGKELTGESFWHQLVQKIAPDVASREGEKYLEKRIGASGASAPSSSGGWKVVR